jgi:hypothetical protein
MGLIKNEHGVYHVRRKVPKALEEATAVVMGVPKARVSWLKETLGTKDEKQAKIRAKPIMMKFDGILAKAEALLVEHPVRTELTEAEIKRIADYFYADTLRGDEDLCAEALQAIDDQLPNGSSILVASCRNHSLTSLGSGLSVRSAGAKVPLATWTPS